MRKIVVPYEDRETVEKLGGKRLKGSIYSILDEDIEKFLYWNREDLNTVIKGEDRDFGKNYLYVDLIPSSSWFVNVREYVDSVDWERIKEMSKLRLGNKCELCKAEANYFKKNYLECHERFSYNKETGVQKLERFLCVCSKCHQSIHFGLSQLQGREEEAKEHLKKVNKWDEKRVLEHIENRFSLWDIKSKMSWKLDLSLLQNMDLPSFDLE